MIKKVSSNVQRIKRHYRIRNKINGTAQRPRLSVYRSLNHIYAQLIDDTAGVTLASASTLSAEFGKKPGGNVEAAKEIGLMIAKEAQKKGITEVVFDRSGYVYHGRVAALAEGAREGGLVF